MTSSHSRRVILPLSATAHVHGLTSLELLVSGGEDSDGEGNGDGENDIELDTMAPDRGSSSRTSSTNLLHSQQSDDRNRSLSPIHPGAVTPRRRAHSTQQQQDDENGAGTAPSPYDDPSHAPTPPLSSTAAPPPTATALPLNSDGVPLAPSASVQAARSGEDTNFTLRGTLVGLAIGVLICFSNTYFGLQTGWVSGMTMPASLIGFAFFKAIAPQLRVPFSPVENVLVQTVATAVGTMPLGVGCVGVVPALEFLLRPEDDGLPGDGSGGNTQPLRQKLSAWRLGVWSVGVCLFGVFVAVPLRRQYVIRERLRFPSGTATALMIGVLHGGERGSIGGEAGARGAGARARKSGLGGGSGGGLSDDPMEVIRTRSMELQRSRDSLDAAAGSFSPSLDGRDDNENDSGYGSTNRDRRGYGDNDDDGDDDDNENAASKDRWSDWRARIRLMTIAFSISAFYTLCAYFVPILHSLPVFGTNLASSWLWDFNPSPAYIGQGIIMGPQTTTHMLIGALLGWAVLSPLAKSRGWAPGPVGDWETGSKGWIVWVSLAIMLADSVVNIGWLALRPVQSHAPAWFASLSETVAHRLRNSGGGGGGHGGSRGGGSRAPRTPARRDEYLRLANEDSASASATASTTSLSRIPTVTFDSVGAGAGNKGDDDDDDDYDVDDDGAAALEPDAPPEHLVGNKTVAIGFCASILLCIATVHIAFPGIIPFWATVLAILFSLVLSLMGVRALGETDLNPVSGISKLTQLAFAALLPKSSPNAVTVNLLAGAISESAALQAGDMMQDLKTGHLLGASPKAQFYGQIIGSVAGALVATLVYRLYTAVYDIPGGIFQVPTAYVWIFTARLVTGQGLPDMAWPAAVLAGAIWCALTALRIFGRNSGGSGGGGGGALALTRTRSGRSAASAGAAAGWWLPLVPGGIAVAVGMYNVPSFTLARALGGFVHAYWTSEWRRRRARERERGRGGRRKRGRGTAVGAGSRENDEETMVVLASGLILGEGVISIVNLVLASLSVPHL